MHENSLPTYIAQDGHRPIQRFSRTGEALLVRSESISPRSCAMPAALGAEATPAGSHTQAHLATHVVQLALGQRIHDVFGGTRLSHTADDLLVRGSPLRTRLPRGGALDRVEARFLGGQPRRRSIRTGLPHPVHMMSTPGHEARWCFCRPR